MNVTELNLGKSSSFSYLVDLAVMRIYCSIEMIWHTYLKAWALNFVL